MSRTPTFLYDPSTAEFQADIWDVYRELRDHHPVHHDLRASDDVRAQFVLSRFDDVWAAVNDAATFSNVVEEAQNLLPQMIYMDAPRHTALRSLVSRAFTPKRVAAVEAVTRATARQLLDDIAVRGRCELQHEYAAILPSVVIAQMIGVPDEHVADFRTWTESFLEIQGPDDFAQAAANIYGLFAELLEDRRARPRDDMMTALIDAEANGQRLTDDELLGFCLLLILAGNDTTSSLIGSGMVLLAAHDEARAALVRDPSLWPAAIEEINRLESPTQVLPRTATRDVELHGVTIPAGSRVMLVWGAANRDEREFPEPDRLDLTRAGSRHLAFGHGAHYCLGANLARLEARVAFEEWFARFPDYTLDGEPRRITSIWARGYSRVPVRTND
jgi:cytochrome P450